MPVMSRHLPQALTSNRAPSDKAATITAAVVPGILLCLRAVTVCMDTAFSTLISSRRPGTRSIRMNSSRRRASMVQVWALLGPIGLSVAMI
jgi:hypothetical protein